MFGWLDAHSGAVQALASIAALGVTTVLAILTTRYVRLTKNIADSAVEQARILRDSVAGSQVRTRDSLRAHALRLLSCVKVLHDSTPNLDQLQGFTLITEPDVTRLEALAKDHGERLQPKSATVATALNHLLGWHDRAAKTNRFMGWNVTPTQVADYARARADAIRVLGEIAAAVSDDQ